MAWIDKLEGHRLESVRLIKEHFLGDTRRVEVDISDMELVLNNRFPKEICTTRFVLQEREFIELLANYYGNKTRIEQQGKERE